MLLAILNILIFHVQRYRQFINHQPQKEENRRSEQISIQSNSKTTFFTFRGPELPIESYQ
jgi:gamma-glutamyl-gamma-aminobutyrate hydrolase PuuD